MNKTNPRKVVTNEVRLSYLFAFKPHAIADGQASKYSCSVIIPKSDVTTVNAIKEAIKAAYEEGKSKFGKTAPALQNLKTPLRDGDAERSEDPAYKDSYFINANSTRKPSVVDADCNPIIDENDIKSGDYGRVSIMMYAYNANGNKGIAAGLQSIMKLRDGEALGGVSSPKDDFLPFADDDKSDDFLK